MSKPGDHNSRFGSGPVWVPAESRAKRILRNGRSFRSYKEFFDNGAGAFQGKRSGQQTDGRQKRIEFLEKKVQTKDDDHYNTLRLRHRLRGASGHAGGDAKLKRQLAHREAATTMVAPGETEAGNAGMQPC